MLRSVPHGAAIFALTVVRAIVTEKLRVHCAQVRRMNPIEFDCATLRFWQIGLMLSGPATLPIFFDLGPRGAGSLIFIHVVDKPLKRLILEVVVRKVN